MHRDVDNATVGVTEERVRSGLTNQRKSGALQRPHDLSSGHPW
jgi:hypothetical protein